MAEEKQGWFEDRLELKKPLEWFLYREVPHGVGWWYTLGSATLVVFIIQLFTGLFLMLNYSPSPDHAYDSVRYIMTSVTFGTLIRSIHFYAASAMVILIVLHLVRVYFMAAYRYPRELTWVVGVVLLVLVLGSSFTGYLLPWDQRAFWATNVATGIAGEVPLIGHWVQQLLIGGTQIGTLTLTRFFTFHVGALPALIALFIGFHIFMVVRQGISGPPTNMKFAFLPGTGKKEIYKEQYEVSKKGGEPFFPNTIARDSLMALAVMIIIMTLAIAFPHSSEAPADPTSTTYNPRPEWYFLFFFQFLKLFPGWLEPVAAVVFPALAFLLLLAVPFLSRGLRRQWSTRKLALGTGGVAVIVLVVLEVTGAITAPSRQIAELSPLAINGERVYREVNCSYCHAINGQGGAIGPDLSNIASQLTEDQIMTYLRNPDSMVPNTLHPKLQFTQEELDALTAYLLTLGAPVSYTAQAPILFQQNCGGCHMVNGQGGTEGPDLSSVGSRRSVTFLESFISDPRAVVPDASMPAFHNALSPAQITDIAAYLFSLKGQTTPPTTPTPGPPTSTTPVTPTPGPAAPPTTAIDASQLYSQTCAACHGADRQGGNGPPLTTSALAGQTTSGITDVISRGSDGMPGFSSTLSPEEINALASYLKAVHP